MKIRKGWKWLILPLVAGFACGNLLAGRMQQQDNRHYH